MSNPKVPRLFSQLIAYTDLRQLLGDEWGTASIQRPPQTSLLQPTTDLLSFANKKKQTKPREQDRRQTNGGRTADTLAYLSDSNSGSDTPLTDLSSDGESEFIRVAEKAPSRRPLRDPAVTDTGPSRMPTRLHTTFEAEFGRRERVKGGLCQPVHIYSTDPTIMKRGNALFDSANTGDNLITDAAMTYVKASPSGPGYVVEVFNGTEIEVGGLVEITFRGTAPDALYHTEQFRHVKHIAGGYDLLLNYEFYIKQWPDAVPGQLNMIRGKGGRAMTRGKLKIASKSTNVLTPPQAQKEEKQKVMRDREAQREEAALQQEAESAADRKAEEERRRDEDRQQDNERLR